MTLVLRGSPAGPTSRLPFTFSTQSCRLRTTFSEDYEVRGGRRLRRTSVKRRFVHDTHNLAAVEDYEERVPTVGGLLSLVRSLPSEDYAELVS